MTALIDTRTAAPMLDVVIPVYNEETDLEPCVRRLHAHMTATLPYRFRITIADNASTDSTLCVAERLARGARVVRGRKREFISRCYNLILRGALRARFTGPVPRGGLTGFPPV